MAEESIVIDLDNAPDSRLRSNEQLIQTDAIAKFWEHMRTLRDSAAAYRNDFEENGKESTGIGLSHNAVVLNGGRGSGKTTLLLNLLSSISEPSPTSATSTDEKLSGLHVLDSIDPTLIEPKDHIFIYIVNMVREAVEQKLDSRSSDSSAFERNGRVSSVENEWRESLQRLAGGMTKLDRVGADVPYKDWDDPQYVMDKGLQQASSTQRLEQAFRNYLYRSLNILRKEAFLVAFDDVDTRFQMGWKVLEDIRKYLANPLLIIVVSGDLELYSHIVRSKQWEQFDERYLNQENKRLDEFTGSVNELEDQYLMKVLKPDKRIDLLRLNKIIQTHKVEVRYSVPKEGSKAETITEEITLYLNKVVQSVFRVPDDLQVYRSFILGQPLRTVLELLGLFNRLQLYRPSRAVDTGAPQEAARAIADITLGSLVRHGISKDELNRADDQDILSLLRQLLNSNDLWDAGYRLRPDLRDKTIGDDHNLALLSFSVLLSSALNQRPGLIFDYFVKVCLPHEASRYVDDMTRYLRFVSRNLSEDSLAEARQNVAVIAYVEKANSKNFSSRRGAIRVYGTKRPELIASLIQPALRQNSRVSRFWTATGVTSETLLSALESSPSLGVTHNTASSLRRKLAPANQQTLMGMLNNLLVCQVVNNSGTSTYYSLMNLFGTLSCILSAETPQTIDTAATVDSKDPVNFASIARCLVSNSQIRTYTAPSWEAFTDGDEILESEDLPVDDEEKFGDIGALDMLASVLYEWKKYVLTTFNIHKNQRSVHFFAKVWSRFYYTILSSDSDVPRADKYLGWMIHRYIVAFLNAVLVEESIEKPRRVDSGDSVKPRSATFSLNNPTTDDGIFLSNLGTASQLSSKNTDYNNAKTQLEADAPIFAAIFACPIWAAFLDPEVMLQSKYGGNRLINFQTSFWKQWMEPSPPPPAAHAASATQVPLDAALEVMSVDYSFIKGVDKQFPNLFDPLNSVLLTGRGK